MLATNAILLLYGTTLLSMDRVASQNHASGVTINADGSGKWIVNECQPCGSVEWKSSGQSLNVMLTGTGTGYIAVDLSDDKLMGPSDQAYVCMTTGSQDSIHSAILVGRELPRFGENITLKEGSSMSSVNGMLACNFTIDSSMTVQAGQVMQYHLLYAQGAVEMDSIRYHFSNRSSTADKVCLTGNCQVTTTQSNYYVRSANHSFQSTLVSLAFYRDY